jgi:hypothetical protein
MPYIKKNLREKYNDHLDEILDHLNGIPTKGDLEYCIFRLMKIYMMNKEQTYTELHNCVYAAQHCADEFRRRFLDAREDKARKENGDV